MSGTKKKKEYRTEGITELVPCTKTLGTVSYPCLFYCL